MDGGGDGPWGSTKARPMSLRKALANSPLWSRSGSNAAMGPTVARMSCVFAFSRVESTEYASVRSIRLISAPFGVREVTIVDIGELR